jgi:hypothetical protein
MHLLVFHSPYNTACCLYMSNIWSLFTNSTNKIHKTLMFLFKKNSYMFRVSLAHHQGVQLYKTITRPYYHLQYTEL